MKLIPGLRLTSFKRTGTAKARRKRKASGRASEIKILGYLIVLISALVPLALHIVVSWSRLAEVVADDAMLLAETLRDSRSERIAASVRNAFDGALSAAVHAFDTGTLNRYNAPDTLKVLTGFLDRELFIERIAIYDRFKDPVAAVDRKGDLAEAALHEPIRLRLQELRFETDEIVLEIDLGDFTSRLVLFARISSGTAVRGFVTAIFDYTAIPGLLTAPEPASMSIVTGRYQRIADSTGFSEFKVVIDPLVERMLDGYTETVRVESEIHSYGYIDFTDAELFIDVVVPLSVGSAPVETHLVQAMFFLLATALCATALAWAHVRSIVRYGESVLVRNRFSRHMRLFANLSSNLQSVHDRIDSISDLRTQLDALRNDIAKVVEELPPGDPEHDR